MSDRLPLTAEEIDPAWLDAVLAERHPGVAVASVEVVERHELTNAHARLAVAYHFDAGAPTTLFAKLPPSEPARRESIAATGMGRSEVRFYNNLAPRTALGGRCIGFDESLVRAPSPRRVHRAGELPDRDLPRQPERRPARLLAGLPGPGRSGNHRSRRTRRHPRRTSVGPGLSFARDARRPEARGRTR